jgi:hypothetical protein
MRAKISILSFILFLIPIALVGQTWRNAGEIRSGVRGTAIGTITDLDAGRSRLSFQLDNGGRDSLLFVEGDSFTTKYLGFEGGGAIFTGTSGFAKLRVGDRLEVRGVGTSTRGIDAEEIILLGRSINASPGTSPSSNVIEGTVRTTRASDFSFVLETSRRELIDVAGRSNTPVYYQGQRYAISNLEPGDRVRVEIESRNGNDEITARSIEVIQNVRGGGTGGGLSSVDGTITRVDTRLSTVRIRPARGSEITIDAREAYDESGRRIRLADLRTGDRITVTGRYGANNTTFIADTIRWERGSGTTRDDDRDDDRDVDGDDDAMEEFSDDYDVVTLDGTVDVAWASGWFRVTDSAGERYNVYADRDFFLRTTTGTAVATRIRRGDRVSVRALRDREGRYIAQSIRVR